MNVYEKAPGRLDISELLKKYELKPTLSRMRIGSDDVT